jgi:hypothetical protein
MFVLIGSYSLTLARSRLFVIVGPWSMPIAPMAWQGRHCSGNLAFGRIACECPQSAERV